MEEGREGRVVVLQDFQHHRRWDRVLIMPPEAAGPQDKAVPEGRDNAGIALPPQLPGAPGEALWHCQHFSLLICQVS